MDESNHGKFPEIFVAVYSRNPHDLKEQKLIPKKRKKEDIENIVEWRDFKYLVISEPEGKLLGAKNTSLVAFSELIKAFSPLEKIIIDGEIRKPEMRELKKILYPTPYPTIHAVAKGDTKFKLVNMADQIANILHRHYYSTSQQ